MALKTVQLGVGRTHAVPTGIAKVRHRSSNRLSDSTRSFSARDNSVTFTGGNPVVSGTYRPAPMPRVHLFIPYPDKVRNEIV